MTGAPLGHALSILFTVGIGAAMFLVIIKVGVGIVANVIGEAEETL